MSIRSAQLSLVALSLTDAIINGALRSWRDKRLATQLIAEVRDHACELAVEGLTDTEIEAIMRAVLDGDGGVETKIACNHRYFEGES